MKRLLLVLMLCWAPLTAGAEHPFVSDWRRLGALIAEEDELLRQLALSLHKYRPGQFAVEGRDERWRQVVKSHEEQTRLLKRMRDFDRGRSVYVSAETTQTAEK